jgi:hypothetical protein
MRRVTAPRVRTTNPLASRADARRETVARKVSAPGTVACPGTRSATPPERAIWWTETRQEPAPPPASESATRSEALRVRRSSPNDRLVGWVKSSGWSARGSQIIPPPSRVGGASRFALPKTAFPVETSADCTWATVQPGWRCRNTAAAPATCGEAMLVPSRKRHVPSRRGTEERIPTPGAVTSGFSFSEKGAGPPDENGAITPVLLAAATLIALGVEAGEPTEPGPRMS